MSETPSKPTLSEQLLALETRIDQARLAVCEVALACRWRLELGRLAEVTDALQALLDRKEELERRVAMGRKVVRKLAK